MKIFLGIPINQKVVTSDSTVSIMIEVGDNCEDIGLQHAWEMVKNNAVCSTYPISYPPQKRKCINCGKEQIQKIVQEEINEWVDLE